MTLHSSRVQEYMGYLVGSSIPDLIFKQLRFRLATQQLLEQIKFSKVKRKKHNQLKINHFRSSQHSNFNFLFNIFRLLVDLKNLRVHIPNMLMNTHTFIEIFKLML